MARSTAFEKLRVAHELQRRPAVADAFRRGDLSYSMARALTRMDRPHPDVEAAIVEAVIAGRLAITDVEMLVRSFRLYSDQERPPADEAAPRRDVRIYRSDSDTAQIVITLDALEAEEFAAAIDAFMDLHHRRAVDESSAGDPPDQEAPLEQASAGESRAEALMTMVRTAVSHPGDAQPAGVDRYLVHLIKRPDTVTFLDGRPLPPGTASVIGCDCATVVHTVGPGNEPLDLGRKTREWSTAQRRAISVRDAGHCRFVGCHNRYYDIHHIQWWEHGGPTDINNGCCQCRRHHRMLHHGYRIEGNPTKNYASTAPTAPTSAPPTPPPPPSSPQPETRQTTNPPAPIRELAEDDRDGSAPGSRGHPCHGSASQVSPAVVARRMTMPKDHGHKEDGTPITDQMVEAMADEAEAGYEVDEIIRRRGGRPAGHGCRTGYRGIGALGS